MENFDQHKTEVVFKTCLLLVRHFKNLIEYQQNTNQIRVGYNSRIFQHMLHRENHFVTLGNSEKLSDGVPAHPEHVVPCAYMIDELDRLIKEGRHSDEELARALQKNWKIAYITKDEARYLDFGLKLKSRMPQGWDFMTGRPEERLEAAGIKLVQVQSQ
ncbi:hypothetical protein [Neisseria dumasiana]|uniref:hypothetical protein n=1 Tax=Neisseria dumasiana TaxID=1931275 RepID=UPI000A19198B|nr:hypothetical protein [Neisseria dumasiana]OSI15493.1 hypothetical protein BV914_07070 [Neisseria dumasiana]